MISRTKLVGTLSRCRHFSTSLRNDFKFKLTDEMIKDHEAKNKKLDKTSPELAVTTKVNSLIMGKVSSDRYKKVVKVGVTKHRLNDLLLLYLRETDDVHAYDEGDICKPGDWVLLRKETNPTDEKVTHRVERVVYSYGHYVDPITNRRCFGLYYDDDLVKLEKIKLDI